MIESEMGVVVHGKPGCPHCDLAKKYLDAADLPYRYIEHDEVSKLGVKDRYNAKTFPVIVINGAHVGGFRELLQLGAGAIKEALQANPMENLNDAEI